MNMSVKKKCRLFTDQELSEAGKSAMGKILAVIDPECRGMGDKDIHALLQLKLLSFLILRFICDSVYWYGLKL